MIRSTTSWSEVVLYPHRVLGFRKRAQSAEEESNASLQHLTLTEFLKEYVFAQMASQPCMCGWSRSNSVIKPFLNYPLTTFILHSCVRSCVDPSGVDCINTFFFRSIHCLVSKWLHVLFSLHPHCCLSPKKLDVTSIRSCQYLTHY